ncbi:MAG: CotH kinase family protein [Saprospiraceae bacterium]
MKKTFLFFALFHFLQCAFSQQNDFYDISRIPEIKITFRQKNWMSMLDSLKVSGSGMLAGDVSIDGTSIPLAGIRYKGTSSFKFGEKRNPYYIKLNFVNKNASYKGVTSLNLSNALRDPSMVREVLGYEIARQYMAAPQANFCKLFVNEAYIGLFVNVETIEENFLNNNFGTAENTLIKCNSDAKSMVDGCRKSTYSSLEFEENENCYFHNYELLSKQGWDDFFGLVKTLNKNPEAIASVLDVDKILWMLAYNNVLVNLNSYSGGNSQNYFLYKDKTGKFQAVIWDLNLNFGSFKNTGTGESDCSLQQLQELDPLLHWQNPAKPLISKLLSNTVYQKMYIAHCKSILEDWINNGKYLDRAKDLQDIARNAYNADPNKYYKESDLTKSLDKTIGEHSKIPGLSELMGKRARFLRKHWSFQPQAPVINTAKVLSREKYATENVSVFTIQVKVDKFPKKVKIYYRSDKNQPFKEAQMKDDGRNYDLQEGDKIFGIKIDPKGAFDTIEYYILAENAQAVSFYPSYYSIKPAQVSLLELNK